MGVGNLAFRTSWQGLKDHFTENGHGVGYVKVIEDRYQTTTSGRPVRKGWGIVEFDTVKQAQKALDRMNESWLDERQLYMHEDRDDHDLGGKGKGKGGGKGKGNKEKGKGKGKGDKGKGKQKG